MSKFVTFRTTQSDTLAQPMFFGDSVNIARHDVQKYIFFTRLTELAQSFFWIPMEVDCTRDRNDFRNKLKEHERRIVTENWKYQVVMDSVQVRGPGETFMPFASLPEIEGWIPVWMFFEGIHNQAYSHLIRVTTDDPSIVFDKIIDNPEIVARAIAVSKEYDKLYDMKCEYHHTGTVKCQHPEDSLCVKKCVCLKRQLFRALVVVNALEAIRFFVSFACTFAFGERGLLEGNTKIMRFIARDEDLHCKGTEKMINILLSGEDGDEQQAIAQSQVEYLRETMKEVAEQECIWADHVFRDGSMIGLNADILKQYVRYRTNLALKRVSQPPAYADVTSDPLPWMNKYLVSDNVQVAPQESEVSSYQVGQLDPSVSAETLNKYDDL